MNRQTLVILWALLSTTAHALGAYASDTKMPGKALIDKNGCTHCHIVGGDGGTVAPPLDGIAQHRDKKYIIGRLENKTIEQHVHAPYPLPPQLMQHVKVGPADAKLIADYLLSLPDREAQLKAHGEGIGETTPAGSHFTPLKPNASTRRGALLYVDRGCAACHSISSVGGHLAPDLSGVGVRRSRAFIENRIANGAILITPPNVPNTHFAMPPHTLSATQVHELTNFLLTLPPEKAGKK